MDTNFKILMDSYYRDYQEFITAHPTMDRGFETYLKNLHYFFIKDAMLLWEKEKNA